ncbi:carbon-nitrogen hydrolase family protein [Candidatus Bathyarchaeota archaeon]|nr:carbon-nitrogen hydrolase family protein [Candidatus Bathyarchaeota archaeon]MCK4482028.1 carbon-nitrogen hydrolase family protein [Candidatus Bathyarchaeota archaeon]
MKERIKVALAQISCKQGDKAENIRKIEDNVIKAKQQGAELIIFPEFSLTGYTMRDRVYELAETIPGHSTTVLEKLAKKTGTYIVFGMPELSEKTQATIYNAAVLVCPDGFVGKYRKMYLPTHSVFEEKRYFRPGCKAEAFDTKLGKIGLIICYDIFFPEVSRLTRLKGAQLIVCISASPATRRTFFETLTAARAIENTAFLAYVNLVGIEDGLQFWGGSRLIAPNGKVLVKAKYDEEDLVIGEINYADIRPIEAFVPTLKDLRPELFDELREAAERL